MVLLKNFRHFKVNTEILSFLKLERFPLLVPKSDRSPFPTVLWPEKLRNGHETVSNGERSGTLGGLKWWFDMVSKNLYHSSSLSFPLKFPNLLKTPRDRTRQESEILFDCPRRGQFFSHTQKPLFAFIFRVRRIIEITKRNFVTKTL